MADGACDPHDIPAVAAGPEQRHCGYPERTTALAVHAGAQPSSLGNTDSKHTFRVHGNFQHTCPFRSERRLSRCQKGIGVRCKGT